MPPTLFAAANLVVLTLAATAQADGALDEAVRLHASAASQTASPTDREIAQFELGLRLHEAHMPTAAVGIFREIADHPTHARFRETLPLLVALAEELPDADLVVESFSKYDEATTEAVPGAAYWAARYRIRNHELAEAARRFERVPSTSKYRAQSQYRAGLARVLLRDPDGAIADFERVIAATDETGDARQSRRGRRR